MGPTEVNGVKHPYGVHTTIGKANHRRRRTGDKPENIPDKNGYVLL